MTDLTIRPLRPGETALFLSYPFPRQPELWETKRDYAALLAVREYRPEHTWVAIRDGVVVARACWWTGRDDERPYSLDWLEAMPGDEQVDLGAALLLTAHETMRNAEGRRPDYHLFLPPGWQEHPPLRAAGHTRLRAAQLGGLTPFVERYNYSWSAERDGLPPRSDRLEFRPADDAEMLAVLRELLVDTLDADLRRAIAAHGIDRAAELQLRELYWFPSPREWWQLAYTRSGDLVGTIVPRATTPIQPSAISASSPSSAVAATSTTCSRRWHGGCPSWLRAKRSAQIRISAMCQWRRRLRARGFGWSRSILC